MRGHVLSVAFPSLLRYRLLRMHLFTLLRAQMLNSLSYFSGFSDVLIYVS